MAIISKLKAVLSLDNKQFKEGLNESKDQVKGFGGIVSKLGPMIAGAFSAGAVVRFGIELANIQNKANAVGKSFAQLGITLESLRSATGGGIGDLRLQQMAVQASNLGLNVKQLATYFEFATKRAAETGESIEYLVNSIVTGIGRKSILILDNLGISSLELQKEFKKTGDFAQAAGNIIERELGESVVTINEAVSGMDRLNTSFDNFMLAASSQSGHTNKLLKAMAGAIDGIGDNIDYVHGVTERWLRVWSFGLSDVVIDGLTDISDGIDNINNAAGRVPPWLQQYLTTGLPAGTLGPIFGGEQDVTPAQRTSTATDIDAQGDRGVFANPANYISGWEQARDVLSDYSDTLTDTNMVMREYGDLSDNFAPSAEDIQDWKDYEFALTAAGQQVAYLNQALSDAATQGIAMAAQAIGTMIGGDTESALENFVQGIAGLLEGFGALLISFGVSLAVLKDSMNPYAMIAAGAALVIIGAAMSASLGGISSAAGGGGSAVTGGYGGGGYSGGSGYDYNREIVLVARGEDLVGVINRQNYMNNTNG